MADSATERQRRWRHHKRGDHSLCAPGRPCRNSDALIEWTDVRDGITLRERGVPRDPATGRGARGQALYDALLPECRALAEELLLDDAARTVDILDDLHLVLTTEPLIRTRAHRDGRLYAEVHPGLLAERQHLTALVGLLAPHIERERRRRRNHR